MQKRKYYYVIVAVGLLLLGGMMSFGPKKVLAAIGFTPVREVDNPVRNPYQQAFFVFMAAGESGMDVDLAPVPAGKRLVIEYVSIRARLASDQTLFMVLGTTAGGAGANHSIPVSQTFATFINSFRVVGGETLRIYADPGTTPFLSVDRNNTVGGMDGIVTVSGYYVTL